MKKIKSDTLQAIQDYLLKSVLPSRDVQQIIRLLNEAEDIPETPLAP